MSRREMLKLVASAGVGVALGIGGAGLLGPKAASPADAELRSDAANPHDFYGEHQAGIATPAQRHLVFAAFDLTTDRQKEVRELLKTWTTLAAGMTLGKVQAAPDNPNLPPEDTGEGIGLFPASLTLTFGFGPTLFLMDGADRFGIAGKRPAALADIPSMPGDALDPGRSGGDLCVQACADDPQVAFYAIHNLTRAARGAAVIRWMQKGFNSIPAVGAERKETPRNLFGFKDGTANLDTQNADQMNRFIWVNGSDSPLWMQRGTYLVTRRIRMLIEVWDRTSFQEQEMTFGRYKMNGASFGGTHEFDEADLYRMPEHAHVRLARGDGSVQILRRGYSYADGLEPTTGEIDAGLFFASFQRDIAGQFIPLLQRLSKHDKLNEYTKHVGSAVFAIPPGTRPGGYIGETLFG